MQCVLVLDSTKLESRVDLAGATVVEPNKKCNKCCVMCADAIAQTHDSQHKFSNVHLALGSRYRCVRQPVQVCKTAKLFLIIST